MSLHGHLECYHSLGELIDNLTEVARIDRAALASRIGVSARTLSRWCGGQTPHVEHLRWFASECLLPFELLLRLANRIPTFANLQTRRFAYSEWDLDFVNKKILQEELFYPQERLSAIEIVEVRGELQHVLNSDREVYKHRRPSFDIFARAVSFAPSFNLIARGPHYSPDRKKGYSGHLLAFPLQKGACAKLRQRDLDSKGRYAPLLHEGDLKLGHLARLDDPEFGGLHIYSLFAFNSQVAYALLRQLVWELVHRWELLTQRQAYLSQYVVTADSRELAKKLELKHGFDDLPEMVRSGTEVTPAFWEAPVVTLGWLDAYRSKRRE